MKNANLYGMKMGQRIKQKRNATDLTQRQVADYFGIRAPSVSEWENGKSKPDSTKLVALARLLQTSVNYLLTGTEKEGISQRESPPLRLPAGKISSSARAESNADGARIRGRLPLISEVQAGNWTEIVDNFQPGDAEDWIPCPFSHGFLLPKNIFT